MSLESVSGSSCVRNSSAAVTSVALSLIMAAVRALTAVSRAILSSRSDSTSPSAVFRVASCAPERTWRAACSASSKSLFPVSLRSPLRGGRLTS